MIPLSSRRPERPALLKPSAPNRVPYMQTALAYQLLPNDDDDGQPDGRTGFLDHLEELRARIIRSCVAVGVGMLGAFVFIDRIVAFVLAPARRMLPNGTQLV